MKTYLYKGPDLTLGRFGFVRSNDLLVLTNQEADTLEKDPENIKSFERVTFSKTTKIPAQGHFRAALLPGAAEHNRQEQARLDQITKANSETSMYERANRNFTESARQI